MNPASSINTMLVATNLFGLFFGLRVFRIHSIGVWRHLKLPFWCFTIREIPLDVEPLMVLNTPVGHTSISFCPKVYTQICCSSISTVEGGTDSCPKHSSICCHRIFLGFKGGLEHTDRDSAAGDTGDGVFQWFEIRAYVSRVYSENIWLFSWMSWLSWWNPTHLTHCPGRMRVRNNPCGSLGIWDGYRMICREQMTRWGNDMHFAMYWLEEMKASESTPDSQHPKTWKPCLKSAQTAIFSDFFPVEISCCQRPWPRQVRRRSRSRSSWGSQDKRAFLPIHKDNLFKTSLFRGMETAHGKTSLLKTSTFFCDIS